VDVPESSSHRICALTSTGVKIWEDKDLSCTQCPVSQIPEFVSSSQFTSLVVLVTLRLVNMLVGDPQRSSRIETGQVHIILSTPFATRYVTRFPSLDRVLARELDEVVHRCLAVRVARDRKPIDTAERTVKEGHHGGGSVRVIPLGPGEQCGVAGVVGIELVDKVDQVVNCGRGWVSPYRQRGSLERTEYRVSHSSFGTSGELRLEIGSVASSLAMERGTRVGD
jgi:hypothetical protein